MSLIGVLSWALFGLLAGIVAKAISPGAQNISTVMTILLGIGGALAGGFIAGLLGIGTTGGVWSLGHFLVAVGGALLLLFIYNRLAK